jgi:hypothetical protein
MDGGCLFSKSKMLDAPVTFVRSEPELNGIVFRQHPYTAQFRILQSQGRQKAVPPSRTVCLRQKDYGEDTQDSDMESMNRI